MTKRKKGLISSQDQAPQASDSISSFACPQQQASTAYSFSSRRANRRPQKAKIILAIVGSPHPAVKVDLIDEVAARVSVCGDVLSESEINASYEADGKCAFMEALALLRCSPDSVGVIVRRGAVSTLYLSVGANRFLPVSYVLGAGA